MSGYTEVEELFLQGMNPQQQLVAGSFWISGASASCGVRLSLQALRQWTNTEGISVTPPVNRSVPFIPATYSARTI